MEEYLKKLKVMKLGGMASNEVLKLSNFLKYAHASEAITRLDI